MNYFVTICSQQDSSTWRYQRQKRSFALITQHHHLLVLVSCGFHFVLVWSDSLGAHPPCLAKALHLGLCCSLHVFKASDLQQLVYFSLGLLQAIVCCV